MDTAFVVVEVDSRECVVVDALLTVMIEVVLMPVFLGNRMLLLLLLLTEEEVVVVNEENEAELG